jgi:FKBP-type peptidyl-prolyl cis-trans isomerase FkpA
MKAFLRGVAALAVGMCVIGGVAAQSPSPAAAEDKTTLGTDRDKVSYMVGMDVARSVEAIKGDIDLAAFERAVRNAFAGGKPLLDEAQMRQTGQGLMQTLAARRGETPPGVAPGTQVAPPPKDKVGLLIGADVGRSLAPIKEEIELPVFLQALRTVLAGGQSLLAEGDAQAVRTAFSQRMQAKLQAAAAEKGAKNKAEGAKFLAANKTVKGVFSTASGLQYMVLRQGSGPRPKPGDSVRVNYRGTLLDGTVFDSSYDRGQPAEFPLGGVIAGWQEGLGLMPVGAKYRFWIPGELGYGASGTPDGSIGPNAVLVFDVELMDILGPGAL